MEISRTELSSAAAATAGQTSELRGAEILVKSLQAEGVKYVWGYPGGAVLHIYDAFYKQDTIQHVLVRHEQAAVHAAPPPEPAEPGGYRPERYAPAAVPPGSDSTCRPCCR